MLSFTTACRRATAPSNPVMAALESGGPRQLSFGHELEQKQYDYQRERRWQPWQQRVE